MNISKIALEITTAMAGAGLLAVLAAFVAPTDSRAMDNPHSNVNNCGTCHQTADPAWWTDQGATGGVCYQCHYPSSPNKDALSHITSSQYGGITINCTDCHNPHYQRQFRTWKAASYRASGVSTGVTATTLTKTGAGWDPIGPNPPGTGAFTGMVLVPDIRYLNYTYRIASNTAETITIDTSSGDTINLAVIKPGATFAVVYGRLIKEAINWRPVKFFYNSGPNSFADSDATIDGVCQVCHTQTASFNVAGTLEAGSHPASKAGTNCTTLCHSHTASSGGFRVDCNDCHGYPPIQHTTPGGPNGLAKYTDNSTTGSDNEGKHLKHADSGVGNLGYPCETCHTGYAGNMPQEAAKTIDLGFDNFGAGGGQYKGQAVVSYTGHGGTDVGTKDGSRTCTNIYCHSTVQANGGVGAPTYKTPQWLDTATVKCGDCHNDNTGVPDAQHTGVLMDSGSHTPHLSISGVTCNTCHAGNTHANKNIDVTTGTYTSGGAPQNGYGTCSTASCHDNGTGTLVPTPTWGTAVTDCSECHAKQPATGSHTKHLTGLTGFNRNAVCADCHGDAVEGTTPPTGVHRDGDVDVFNDSNTTPNTDLGYLANVAKHNDNNFQSCTTAYCHSNGMNGTVLNAYKSASWGGGSTGCGFCHNALPTTGAHAKHVKTAATSYGSTSVSTTGGSYNFGCGNCHPVDTANHMNGTVDLTLNSAHGGTLKLKNNVSDDTSGYSQTKGSAVTCSAAYCHSKGNGTFVVSLDWYGTFSGDTCGHCHGNQPDTGSHATHVVGIHYNTIYTGTTGLAAMGNTATGAHGNPGTSTTISCNLCHNTTVTTANNDKNAVCAGCHGSSAPLMGNAAIAAGSGTHLNGQPDVAFAAVPVRSKAQVRSDITTITELSDNWTRTVGYKASGAYDLAKNALNTATMWTGASKTCSNISCHNSRTVTWSSTVTCGSCHTALP